MNVKSQSELDIGGRETCLGFVSGRPSAMLCSSLGLIILPVLTLNTTRISIQFIDEL